MKKLLSLGLAAILAFGLATTSFAAEAGSDASEAGTGSSTTTTPTDQETVTIHKMYKLENADTKSPAETFTLEQVGNGTVEDGEAQSAPALGDITGATYAAGAATTGDGTSGDIIVTLPTYDTVGVYSYTLREIAGTTAGVTYYGKDIKLVVTVINDGNDKLRVAAVHTESKGEDKADYFPNIYKAGALSVTKEVIGNLGNKDKEFNVTVTFTKPADKTIGEAISYIVGTDTKTIAANAWTGNTATVTIALKHGQTITFTNIPYDVTYNVTEADYTGEGKDNGYKQPVYEYSDDNKKIDSATDTVKIINEKVGTIDMGVTLNNMPYILVLAVLAAGVAVFVIRKRRED